MHSVIIYPLFNLRLLLLGTSQGNEWKSEGLTGLQEALQLFRADELFPVVRPAGNEAQQLLGYNDAQRVRQVGFIDGSDEERAARLHVKGQFKVIKY